MPTKEDVANLNKMVINAHQHSKTTLLIQHIPIEKLRLVCFTGASWGVRKDGKSQGGFCIVASTDEFMNGEEACGCWQPP